MDNILATTDVIALRASPFYMSVRLGSSLLSRKLLSHPVWSPAGAKRGFIKGWFAPAMGLCAPEQLLPRGVEAGDSRVPSTRRKLWILMIPATGPQTALYLF